jgi:hypothetical protein
MSGGRTYPVSAERCPEKILVVKSESWNRLAEETFDELGYNEIMKAYQNVKLVNLTRETSVIAEPLFRTCHTCLRIPNSS